MTDRVHSLLVVLEQDVRNDDIKSLVNAIREFRNVASVTLNITDPTSIMAEERARYQLANKLWEVLK